MSFSNLSTVTRDLNLVDTNKIFAQGQAAYRAMFSRAANPFKSERDRAIWDRGYIEAQEKFGQMTRRWREMDKGTL